MAGRLRELLDKGMGLVRAATAQPKGGGSGQLPPAPIPKVQKGQTSIPSFLTTAKPADTPLPQRDRRLANIDITSLRTGGDTNSVVREFVAASPDLSAAVNAYLRTAITPNYSVIAYNTDGTFNRDATALAQQIAVRFDTLGSYDDGFSGIWSLRSVSESLGKELMQYGSMALELVLDKARLPRCLAPVSVTKIKFKPDTQWLKPVQFIGGQQIDLDIPTFFYSSLDQDLLQAYSDSPLEAAIQPALFSQEFMNDVRRIIKRAIHPRLSVTIDEEKFKKNVPAELQNDQVKLIEYMNSMITDIEQRMNDLKPEDALVYFDSIKVEYVNNGNQSLSKEYDVLQKIADAKLATGAKTLPSVLGHGSGSQNIASSETLLFMKNAEGTVQAKLNEIYSKAFTLAVRLFGQDVVVEFKYAPVELRPETELEAFKVMKQSRMLELLSYGFTTDDEAALALTGRLTPVGFKPLSGTGFFNPPPAADGGAGGNPNSNTSGPQNRRTKTPQQSKGPQKKAEADVELIAGELVEGVPQITKDEVRAIVEAALAARPGPDVTALLSALQKSLEATVYREVDDMQHQVVAQLCAASEALRVSTDERGQAIATQLAEVAGRVDVLVQRPPAEIKVEGSTFTVAPAEVSMTLHQTVEAAKPGSKTLNSKRNADGSLTTVVEE